jgi:hypothetical protein
MGEKLSASELMERALRMSSLAVDEPVFEEPEQVATPSGFVDMVFDDGRLVVIQDHQGRRTKIGHWLESGGYKVLRLPWPTSLASPTSNRPGRSRNRQPTERAAAMMQFPKSGTARGAVLSAFINDWKDDGDGLIDEDVASKIGMNLYTAAPRRTELVNDGWLQASGRFGRTKLNSESIKWELSTPAIQKLGLHK